MVMQHGYLLHIDADWSITWNTIHCVGHNNRKPWKLQVYVRVCPVSPDFRIEKRVIFLP